MKHVYVISDLHIGGEAGALPHERGFKLNTHTAQLAKFVNMLAEQKETEIELVINGDLVDFLAEKEWNAFETNEERAKEKLQKIIGREKAFFNAVAFFLQSPRHSLTLLLGNHDIELVLPPIRSILQKEMGATTANFRFLYDGEAYTIGDEVIIEHGNRYDSWNKIDEEQLRLMRELFSRNDKAWRTTFIPPKGSVLVEKVMNPLKVQYGFIDLLKPETQAAIPILLAIDPQVRYQIGNVLKLYTDAITQLVKTRDISKGTEEMELDALVDQELRDIFSPTDLEEFNQALDLNQNDATGERGEVKTRSFWGKTLSFLQLLLQANRSELDKRMPALVNALKKLQQPHTFSLHTETFPEYEKAAKELAEKGKFKYIIFGHTHLAKQITLPQGSVYFNTGTWADLMTFPTQILHDTNKQNALAQLQPFLKDLANNQLSNYIRFKPTCVHIELNHHDKVERIALKQYDPVHNTLILPQDGI